MHLLEVLGKNMVFCGWLISLRRTGFLKIFDVSELICICFAHSYTVIFAPHPATVLDTVSWTVMTLVIKAEYVGFILCSQYSHRRQFSVGTLLHLHICKKRQKRKNEMGTYRTGGDFINKVVEYCFGKLFLPIIEFFLGAKQVPKPEFLLIGNNLVLLFFWNLWLEILDLSCRNTKCSLVQMKSLITLL